MTSRGAAIFRKWTLPGVLLLGTAAIGVAVSGAQADPPGALRHAVTATPPLQVTPATPGSKNVQQHMRSCNKAADARRLAAAARETFIKSCMASHRTAPSHAPAARPSRTLNPG